MVQNWLTKPAISHRSEFLDKHNNDEDKCFEWISNDSIKIYGDMSGRAALYPRLNDKHLKKCTLSYTEWETRTMEVMLTDMDDDDEYSDVLSANEHHLVEFFEWLFPQSKKNAEIERMIFEKKKQLFSQKYCRKKDVVAVMELENNGREFMTLNISDYNIEKIENEVQKIVEEKYNKNDENELSYYENECDCNRGGLEMLIFDNCASSIDDNGILFIKEHKLTNMKDRIQNGLPNLKGLVFMHDKINDDHDDGSCDSYPHDPMFCFVVRSILKSIGNRLTSLHLSDIDGIINDELDVEMSDIGAGAPVYNESNAENYTWHNKRVEEICINSKLTHSEWWYFLHVLLYMGYLTRYAFPIIKYVTLSIGVVDHNADEWYSPRITSYQTTGESESGELIIKKN